MKFLLLAFLIIFSSSAPAELPKLYANDKFDGTLSRHGKHSSGKCSFRLTKVESLKERGEHCLQITIENSFDKQTVVMRTPVLSTAYFTDENKSRSSCASAGTPHADPYAPDSKDLVYPPLTGFDRKSATSYQLSFSEKGEATKLSATRGKAVVECRDLYPED